jgi:hypothetical protein
MGGWCWQQRVGLLADGDAFFASVRALGGERAQHHRGQFGDVRIGANDRANAIGGSGMPGDDHPAGGW